jgi:hypothetical protein
MTAAKGNRGSNDDRQTPRGALLQTAGPTRKWAKSMKRTLTLILGTLAAATLFGRLVYAVLVTADISEPAASAVYGLTPRRFWATAAAAVALVGWALAGWLCADPLIVWEPVTGDWGHGGLGRGVDRPRQRWIQFGHCHRWSRHRQRSTRCCRGTSAGANWHGPLRAGSGPLPPRRRGTRDGSERHEHPGLWFKRDSDATGP